MVRKVAIFFTLGLIILALDLVYSTLKDERLIYISEEEVYSLLNTWALQVGRNPNPDEAKAVIDNLIEEEILYREALRLGLDANDQIIKRRLAQKLMFLKQESRGEKLRDEEVLNFYAENKEKYLIPRQFDFTHLFFAKDSNGSARAAEAERLLKKSQEIRSDVFFLGKNFTNKSVKELKKDFGALFAQAFTNLEINEWSEPIESTYGSHLVKIIGIQPERMPSLEEIKPRVLIDLDLQKKDSALSEYLNNLKDEYEIIISRSCSWVWCNHKSLFSFRRFVRQVCKLINLNRLNNTLTCDRTIKIEFSCKI